MKLALIKGSIFVRRALLVFLVCVTLGTSGCKFFEKDDPKRGARLERLPLPHPTESNLSGIPHEQLV